MSERFFQRVFLYRPNIQRSMLVLGGIAGVMWFIELVDWLTGPFLVLDAWGIRPRDLDYFAGIFLAPLLHADFAHLAANTAPFLLLGLLVFWRGEREFWLVTIIVTLTAGLGTWLIGPSRSIHIGASGIVFGYLGFLLLLGWIEQSPTSVVRALLVGIIYGGVLWGIFPFQHGISWQGHFFGLLGGILAAYWLGRREDRLEKNIHIRL